MIINCFFRPNVGKWTYNRKQAVLSIVAQDRLFPESFPHNYIIIKSSISQGLWAAVLRFACSLRQDPHLPIAPCTDILLCMHCVPVNVRLSVFSSWFNYNKDFCSSVIVLLGCHALMYAFCRLDATPKFSTCYVLC